MTVTARLDLVIFDAADIDKVGSFYAELTGWEVVREDSDRFGVRTPDGQEIEFQRAPDHVAPQWPGQDYPQQFHLDLQTDDPEVEAEQNSDVCAAFFAIMNDDGMPREFTTAASSA